MKVDQIREAFLSYFEGQDHLRISSSSLIPVGDPTLLLTTAGMVQIKPYFVGESIPTNPRMTSSQKCFRAVDIEEVGDATHLTFFEMLGNFSVGDYFKKEAMTFALQFLTENLHLRIDQFTATAHVSDDDSVKLWVELGISKERVFKFGDSENWWGPAGSEGPCGPCAELHYDYGSEIGCLQGDCGPNCENQIDEFTKCNRFVELWNLVFMQYYQDLDGKRELLPSPSVDTGMGLERLAVILQGVETIYQTDSFLPLVGKIVELSDKQYGKDLETDYAINAVVEHSRSATFLIADGVVPSNEGRGYVLRRVIRRAIRQARKLGITESFINELSSLVIENMKSIYPELDAHKDFIKTVISLEETRFQETIDRAMLLLNGPSGFVTVRQLVADKVNISDFATKTDLKNLEGILQDFLKEIEPIGKDAFEKASNQILDSLKDLDFDKPINLKEEIVQFVMTISGGEAFLLWDTYGYPVEMTIEIANENNMMVDMDLFAEELKEQQIRSRSESRFSGDRAKIRIYESMGLGATKFVGYDALTHSSPIVGILLDDNVVDHASEGDEVEIAMIETPFYSEGGGQVGDAGVLNGSGGQIEVFDTQSVTPDLVIHFGIVRKGKIVMGEIVDSYVDPVRRENTARNHTATHLLHSALRQVLGEHVRQAGSLVAPDRLRFDFTHVQQLTDNELHQVQTLVNEKIRYNAKVLKSEDSYTTAIRKGALAFFGDKYGETVRLIEIANGETFSFEVCGGTHVRRTGEIGIVQILGETSIGAGMRRLEAVTGRHAEQLIWDRFVSHNRLSADLQVPVHEIEERVVKMKEDLADLRKEMSDLRRKQSLIDAENLLSKVQTINDVKVLATLVESSDNDSMREIGDWLRDKMVSGILILGAVINDRPLLLVMVTQDLVDNGINANEIIETVTKTIQGGGGGSPKVAQAGGRDSSKIEQAISQSLDYVRSILE